MNDKAIEAWLKLSDNNKRNIFEETANRMGLPAAAAVEKDWWVVRTLELVFQTTIKDHTVFKGGTSLSKAWNLIDRFSEDIDLALDRKFLGFEKEMTRTQITKLRKKFYKFVSEKYLEELEKEFDKAGFKDVRLELPEFTSTDEDPVKIKVLYPSVTERSDYLLSSVSIEIGCRSLIEPKTECSFTSFVGEHFNVEEFADSEIRVPSVNPERTFLEKMFLLHEELQKDPTKRRVVRMSRHLYDLEKLMDTEFEEKAFADNELYNHIVDHRKKFTPIGRIDYINHAPGKINIIPPSYQLPEWKKDYESMQDIMIYRKSISFDELIERVTELNSRINKKSNG